MGEIMDIKAGTKWYTVNKTLLPVKVLYFLSMAAIGDLLPFIALYMKQIGMSTSFTGILYGVMPFIGFLFRPLIGSVADKFRKHKFVLALCCVLTGVFYVLLLFVPRQQVVYTQVHTKIHCSPFDSFIHECNLANTSSAMLSCPMTFSEYMSVNLGSDQADVSIDKKADNSSKTPYNTAVVSGDHHSCDVSCVYKSKGSVTSCFTISNTSHAYKNTCPETSSIKLSKKTKLSFVLKNVVSNSKRGISQNGSEISDSTCLDFEMNSFIYDELYYQNMLCSQDVELDCSMKCLQKKNDCTVTQQKHMDDMFWMFFLFFLLGNIFFCPVISIVDAMAYNILGDKRSKWGKQRLWGTLGFAVFAVTSTFIMDRISKNPLEIDFSVSFYIFLGLWILTAICSYFVQASEDIVCSSFLRDACKLFSYPRVVLFMLVVLYLGILNGAIETFFYWFLQDQLDGYFNIIPGLCLLTTCVAETPVLYFSGRIIKRLGHLYCLCLVFIAYFLRFLAYSFLTNAWQALPVELLHGITFGLMWATSTSYASIITPKGMTATVQGLIGGLHFGFGKGIGSLVTGQLYSPLGIRWTFRLYALLSLVLMFMYLTCQKFLFKSKPPDKSPGVDNMDDEITVAADSNEPGNRLLEIQSEHAKEQSDSA